MSDDQKQPFGQKKEKKWWIVVLVVCHGGCGAESRAIGYMTLNLSMNTLKLRCLDRVQ